MNAREEQIARVEREMLCEETGHIYEMGSVACVNCGNDYGVLAAADPTKVFDALRGLTKAHGSMGISARKASQSIAKAAAAMQPDAKLYGYPVHETPQLKPGDMVMMGDPGKPGEHVAIYTGKGTFTEQQSDTCSDFVRKVMRDIADITP